MRIEIARLDDLGSGEIERWRDIQRSNPSVQSPFFTSEYANLIASVRPDVQLAILESSRGVEGFFAIQHAFGSAGMPIGAPLSDYQGVIAGCDTDVDPHHLCRASGVSRFDFTQVPADQRAFIPHARARSAAWVADLSVGAENYFTGVRNRHRTFLYQLGRVARKFTRDYGEMTFNADSQSVPHLEALLSWKADQLADSGQPQVWRRSWVRQTIFRSREQSTPYFGGLLFTLTIGDKLIAANFCFHSEKILHGVLMAHDRAFEMYSPGIQLLRRILEWAALRGFSEADFGVGEQLYKRQFGTHHRATMSGWVGRPSLSSFVRASQYAVRDQIERVPNAWIASLPGRVMRRLDVYRGLAAPPIPGSSAIMRRPTPQRNWRATQASTGTEA